MFIQQSESNFQWTWMRLTQVLISMMKTKHYDHYHFILFYSPSNRSVPQKVHLFISSHWQVDEKFVEHPSCLLLICFWLITGFSKLRPINSKQEVQQISSNQLVNYLINVRNWITLAEVQNCFKGNFYKYNNNNNYYYYTLIKQYYNLKVGVQA